MRERLVYLVARGVTTLVGLLPGVVIRRLGSWLGRAASYVATDKRRMTERHMRRVLGPSADVTAAAREVFASYGRYWAEVLWIRPHRLEGWFADMQVEGLDNIYAARELGNGIIFALPHLGNWEAAGARADREGFRCLAVAEALGNRRLVDWFLAIRNGMGVDVVIAEHGSKVTRELIARLRENGNIALMSDRDLGGRGPVVRFFGEETTLPAGPMALAERTGSPVIPMAPYFLPGKGHRMVLHRPIPVPDAPSREERVALGTQALADKLEEMIREAPTQWNLLVPNWPSDRVGDR